jgi:hypothetical protein
VHKVTRWVDHVEVENDMHVVTYVSRCSRWASKDMVDSFHLSAYFKS